MEGTDRSTESPRSSGPRGRGDTRLRRLAATASAVASLVALGGASVVGAPPTPTPAAGPAVRLVLADDVTLSPAGPVAGGPGLLEASGVTVAVLQFGAAGWDPGRLRSAIVNARGRAEVVVLVLHDGAEQSTGHRPGPQEQTRRMTWLAQWGVDVVRSDRPMPAGPVAAIDPDGDGRPTVVATGLGGTVLGRHGPAPLADVLLEVIAGRDGVRAWRLGTTSGRDAPPRWRPPAPEADAVLLDDGWWQLAGHPATTDVRPDAATETALDQALQPATVLDTALGDVDLDGSPDVVAAFRRPHRETEVGRWLRRVPLVDDQGRSAHVGVYRPGSLRQRWVAGSVLRPVSALAACDGWLAVGLTTLADPTTVTAVGAWRWGGFGFVTLPELAGTGRPACSDVDGDGLLDPVAIERTAS